jgi:hypothetical protein
MGLLIFISWMAAFAIGMAAGTGWKLAGGPAASVTEHTRGVVKRTLLVMVGIGWVAGQFGGAGEPDEFQICLYVIGYPILIFNYVFISMLKGEEPTHDQ